MIKFVGALPASKSLLNRALIVKSFAPELTISGQADSRDVEHMRLAVDRILAGGKGDTPYDCGDAGAVLRFLALRLSRIEGSHILTGSERLFSRPHKELERILRVLGCDVEFSTEYPTPQLRLRSYGWRILGDGLFINGDESSQFASAVLLGAWNLKTQLPLSLSPKIVSEGYWAMTVKMCQTLGMNISRNGHEYIIPPQQKISAAQYAAEADVSSAFAVAALAAMGGQARILNFPAMSGQPDRAFVPYLQKMGIDLAIEGEQLHVNRTEHWQGLQADLNSCPDLLPVLAVLCAYASTPSELRGVGHLAFKESDRLEKTRELLLSLGAEAQIYQNGVTTLKISPVKTMNPPEFAFDPDRDHRMAMAAAVARERGAKIKILTPEVVEKSFSEFWRIAGV